jgi:methyl-accepting chemotaxis protein
MISGQMANEARGSFDQIVDTSTKVNMSVQEIAEEIERMLSGIKEIEGMSSVILELAQTSSEESSNAAASVQQQSAGLQEITGYATLLSEMAIALKTIVSEFKITN